MAKKQTPDAAASNPSVEGAQAAERTYPWVTRVTNDTPIPIYLSETGAHLAANFYPDRNSAVVTYQTEDHYAREMANVDAISSVHGFNEPLIFSDPESEMSGEEPSA